MAILHASMQNACHQALQLKQGQPEPQVTEVLIILLISLLRDSFRPAMHSKRVGLPKDCALELASVSMTTRSDRLASDFALIVGVMVDGEPRLRVALFQAKWEDAPDSADVGYNNGRQLEELAATGMGYYVFYTNRDERPALPMAVVAAVDLFDGNHGGKVGRIQTKAQHGGRVPWEFATFLVGGLASPSDNGTGKLFDTWDEVTKVLSSGRGRPLTADIIAIDLTGKLRVATLYERADPKIYAKRATVRLPTVYDFTHPLSEEAESDDRLAGSRSF